MSGNPDFSDGNVRNSSDVTPAGSSDHLLDRSLGARIHAYASLPSPGLPPAVLELVIGNDGAFSCLRSKLENDSLMRRRLRCGSLYCRNLTSANRSIVTI